MRIAVKRLGTMSPRAQGFLLGFILALLIGAFAGVALSAGSNTIKGCYERKGGALRVRKAGTSCKRGEVKIAWNKVGPRGPAGPKGDTGLQGEPGEPGLLSSFDDVEGLTCTNGSSTGTIEVAYDVSGEVTLTCVVPNSCGNNIVDAGETCDDGNTANGDGCSDSCQTEAPAPVCGDNVVEGGEACDDGNTANGDGCSETCQIEPAAVCGDGLVNEAEQCDDGGSLSGDGCSTACEVEEGYACTGQPSVCTPV